MELLVLKVTHAPDCCANHSQSIKAMELEAWKVMWGCSIAKYSVWYVEMLSDGDSFQHKAVCEEKPYRKDVEMSLTVLTMPIRRWGQPSENYRMISDWAGVVSDG